MDAVKYDFLQIAINYVIITWLVSWHVWQNLSSINSESNKHQRIFGARYVSVEITFLSAMFLKESSQGALSNNNKKKFEKFSISPRTYKGGP